MSSQKSTARWYLVPFVILIGAAAGFGYWKSLQDKLPEGLYLANGRLEATEVQIATKYPGKIERIFFDEGQRVEKGQALAKMDTATLDAQKAQALAEVARAQDSLTAAQANVVLRQSEQSLAAKDLTRFRQLLRTGNASKQLVDQHQTRYDTANAALNAANSNVSAAQAAIRAAEAQVAQIETHITDSTLYAPISGMIQLKVAEEGEVLAAGGRIFLMINPADQFMNVYLPTAVAGKLSVGDDARIVLDALDQPLPAKVQFVSIKSQFTPKEVETFNERQKLVFRVKLRLQDAENIPAAKPGMPGASYVRTDKNVAWPAVLNH